MNAIRLLMSSCLRCHYEYLYNTLCIITDAIIAARIDVSLELIVTFVTISHNDGIKTRICMFFVVEKVKHSIHAKS